jgi:hypothetical protein
MDIYNNNVTIQRPSLLRGALNGYTTTGLDSLYE